jgi:integrase
MGRIAEPYIVIKRGQSFQITLNPTCGLPHRVCDEWQRRSIKALPDELFNYRNPKTKPDCKASVIALIAFLKKKQTEGSAQGVAFQDKMANTPFCDYLYKFWDFKTSEYFRELETMGKKAHEEHASEMQKTVARYYRPYFELLTLHEITEELLQSFIVHLKIDKGLAASTVNSARNVAFVALRYAKRKKHIRDFDFAAVLRAGGEAKARGVLTKEEIEKLLSLEWENTKAWMAVLISYRTDMRIGEVRALRLCDIHETHISVNHSWAKKSKLKGTKTNESREVPILPSLYAEIMAYIKNELVKKDQYGREGQYKLDGFLLQGKKPDRPYDDRRIGAYFNKMLEKIGIDDAARKERNIVFHSWRHLLLAKNLAESGTNKKIAMKILGHKTSKVFDSYAAHADKETFEKMKLAIEDVSQESKIEHQKGQDAKIVSFKAS